MGLQWIVHSITTIFMLFSIGKFMRVFFDSKPTSYRIFYLTNIGYIVLTICSFTFLNTPIINLFCNIATIFIITLNYNSSWLKKFSAVLFVYFFMFTTDLLVSMLLRIPYISVEVSNVYEGVFGYIAMGLIFYFESLLAQNLKNIKKNTPSSISFWISSFTIPLSSIYLTVIILGFSNLKQVIIVSVIIIVFLINILTFYLYDSLFAAYDDKLKSSLFEQEKEYYHNQCEMMHKSTEELKSFRHDVKNLLTTAIKYIEQNEPQNAKEYLEKLTGRTDTNNNYSRTGNVAFDSIINYKLRNAVEKEIELQVDVSVPQKLNIEISDVVTIVGNLLDNAINAVMKVKNKEICLKISFSKGNLFINIKNTFNGDVRCIDGEIVSTDGDNHGYGLKNIRAAVEKHNGYVNIHYIDNMFSVEVFLYAHSI